MERRRRNLEEELFQGAVEKEELLEAEFEKMDKERLEHMIKEDALELQLSEAKESLRRQLPAVRIQMRRFGAGRGGRPQ